MYIVYTHTDTHTHTHTHTTCTHTSMLHIIYHTHVYTHAHSQDLFVDHLTSRAHSLEEQLALHDAQRRAQAQERKALKEAVTEATMELEVLYCEPSGICRLPSLPSWLGPSDFGITHTACVYRGSTLKAKLLQLPSPDGPP